MKWAPLACVLLCAPCMAQITSYGRFRDLAIYQPAGAAEHVVLFLSGQQGWNANLARMAQALQGEGAFVVGIDVRPFLADLERDDAECVFPDGDLENLGRFLQAYYRLPGYRPPMLAGYAAGGTLAYAMLAQAPADTFAGGISLAFCPQLPLKKPLCASEQLRFTRRAQGATLAPARRLEVPWIALQGQRDRMCTASAARPFVAGVRGGGVTVVPRVGHEETAGAWIPALETAFRELASQPPAVPAAVVPDDLQGLPIVAAPAQGNGDILALILSGDGGWATIDKALAASFVSRGVAVVGLDSLRYFWSKRTPAGMAADVDRVLRHYLAAWNRQRVLLIGYSQGADVLPFVLRRLPPQTRARVQLAAMLNPGKTAVFEFHLSSWFSGDDAGQPLRPELQKLAAPRLLCVYGADDAGSVCPELSAPNVQIVELPGGHHFDGDYDRVAALILAALQARVRP